MGNPASVIRKRTEKRRKRYEKRLGPGVYLPKDERLAFNAKAAQVDAAAEKEKKEREAARAKAKAAGKPKKADKAPPAEKGEKAEKK